jgi:pilus assembly protein FimV
LDAKIAINDIESGDLDRLNARILDVNKGSAVMPGTLKIEIIGEQSGHYLRITSLESIREPILSFTIELTWGQGRLIREYDLLIDPAR